MRRLSLTLSLPLLVALAGFTSENPLIGNWTSTTPADAYGAAGCPTRYTFAKDTQTLTMGGRNITMQVTYTVKPNLVVVNMPRASNGFKFITPNSVAWTIGYCTYKRD